MLEHVIEPQRVINEIHRVLTKGGEAFFYLPFLYPYHASPSFKDYHRFTEDLIIYMFRDFDEYVRRIFVDEQITARTEVIKMYHWRPSLNRLRLPSTAFKVSKILLGFEETESIENIARFQRLPIKEVIETIAKAYWQGIVKLQYIPSDDDILELAEKATSIIFHKTNPLALSGTTLSVISLLDGRTSLSNLTNDMIIQDQELLLAEFGLLINNGFIQRISVERRLVLLNQCVLSNLVFTTH